MSEARRERGLAPGLALDVLPPGRTIPERTSVERLLGRGGNGLTYLARRSDGRRCVLKTPRFVGGSASSFTIEAEIARQVHHENVVAFLGSARAPDGEPVLAFERAFENPLLLLNRPERRCRLFRDPGTVNYPLPPGVALDLSLELLRAVEHLHQQGFVHHDVKLANLLVSVTDGGSAANEEDVLSAVSDGRYRGVLIDLGAVRSFDYLRDLNEGRVRDDLVSPQLTPLYAPPEALLENRGAPGERPLFFPSLDVYAAGLTVYALLTGHLPYDHLARQSASLCAADLLDRKRAERRRELSPFSREAIRDLPVHDARFVGDAEATFAADVQAFLSRCVDPVVEARFTASQARQAFERAFRFHASETEQSLPVVQGVVSMDPSSNRLIDATGRAPVRAEAPSHRPLVSFGGGSAVATSKERSPRSGRSPAQETRAPLAWLGTGPFPSRVEDAARIAELIARANGASLDDDARLLPPSDAVLADLLVRVRVLRREDLLRCAVEWAEGGARGSLADALVARALVPDAVLRPLRVVAEHLALRRS